MTTPFTLESLPKHIRVLIIDDDEDDFFLIKDYLGDIRDRHFETYWASNYSDGLSKITEIKPDICLLDFLLGNKTGLNLLREVRDQGNDMPIILLTGKGDITIDREAMALGATDYLIKMELNTENMERSIRYTLAHTAALRGLRANAQMYRTIFDKSKNMIYLVDAETLQFVEVNDMATHIFGYDKEYFLKHMTFYDLFDNKQDAEKIEKILRDKGDITDYEVSLRTQKGDAKIFLLSAVNHKTAQGAIHFHGTIADATQIRQIEQDRLIAEKLAATSRLTRALAHEVRNPLTNIDLSIEQIESEYPDSEWSDYLDIIKRNSRRIGTLITELLNTSNPSKLEFSIHKLNDLLEEAIEMAKDRITLKNITVIKNYATQNPLVSASAEAFNVAILNIIVNAIEAISEVKGIITISTLINNDECYISIEDNGCGIPADQLTRIFEPYVTTKPKGTGLGLITTLNVLRAHKGILRVNSILGKGTRFLITLPIINDV